MRLRPLLLAAASPLCLLAGQASAETTISTAVANPVATATAASGARDDLKIAAGGSVKPTGGAAVSLNSNNRLTIEGDVAIQNANNATGVALTPGVTGELRINSGTITLDETAEIKDADGDGDNDGPFAVGSNRVGVRLAPGAEMFHGSITRTGGAISIEGVDSAGISLEGALEGALRSGGTTTVTGDRSYGIHALSTIGGEVSITGAVTAQGQGAVAVALDQNVGGRLTLQSAISATGFRYTTRPADAAVAKLDADDLLIGGPAVRIQGDVAGGVLVDVPPVDMSATDTDEDKDGVPDAQEGSGSITSFGSAPAMLIGAAGRDVRIGSLVSTTDPQGLVIKGVVQSAGVYDGIAATGLQLGGLGGAVTVQNGIKVTGQVNASAAKADARAVLLGAGTTANLWNGGQVRATSTATDAVNVRAVQIDAGANTASLANTGAITAAITGTKGSATAILDASGSLRTIENNNQIVAAFTPTDTTAAVTGRAVALDLRANTAGVTVRQLANPTSTVTPTITGDVLFGSGAARLELQAGVLNGAVAFGSGADTLAIDGGARLTGALTDAGGGLAVAVNKGRLTTTNVGAVNLTSLTLGSTGELVVTADPAAGTATKLNVAGDATLASGAKVGLRFTSKLSAPATYTLIQAGRLVSGTLDQSLLGATPWLYKAELRVDQAQNALLADVRRRTASEAGLSAVQAQAYDAVFANFDRDASVRDAVLSKTDAAGFTRLYDQFLPDHSGGLFQVLAQASDAAGRALDEPQGLLSRDNLRIWTQEIGFIVDRKLDAGGYDATGFGIAGGVEIPDTGLGTVGVQTSFVTADVDEDGAAASESLDGTVFAAGLYWRGESGGLTGSLGATAGFASMEGKRAVVDSAAGLSKTAESDWDGMTVAVHGGVAYRFQSGAFYARPQLAADYFRLKEDGRTESGGGAAVDLQIDDRESSQLAAFAGISLGASWGEESAFIWSPEVTLGWRHVSGDGAGVTTARFVAGGPAFSLAAPDVNGGGGVVRAALRGQGEYFDFAVEGGGEFRDDYQAYDARVVARFLF